MKQVCCNSWRLLQTKNDHVVGKCHDCGQMAMLWANGHVMGKWARYGQKTTLWSP